MLAAAMGRLRGESETDPRHHAQTKEAEVAVGDGCIPGIKPDLTDQRRLGKELEPAPILGPLEAEFEFGNGQDLVSRRLFRFQKST